MNDFSRKKYTYISGAGNRNRRRVTKGIRGGGTGGFRRVSLERLVLSWERAESPTSA